MAKSPSSKVTRRTVLAGLMAGPSVIGRPAIANSGDVVILTSFPPSFYEPFRLAFERAEPAIRLRMVNRKTTAALAIVEDADPGTVDVFWASSPDAFAVLKAKGHLLQLEASAVPAGAHIRGYPIDDAEGFFRGFTISGYGISWNRARLEQLGLALPDSAAELAAPAYRGLIAMSAPSRSGTTHLMVETILQHYGWERGWKIWLQIAANLANITARSFSVASGVAQGRYGIGLSIDFIGRGSIRESNVGFKYPSENVFLPASIALVRGSRNPDKARRFAQFVLSEAGQRLLLEPSIQRQPVMPKIAAQMSVPLLPPEIWSQPSNGFDAHLSGRRYELVNLIFDELITERLLGIQRFWRNANAISPLARPVSSAAKELAAIVELSSQPPAAILELGSHDALPKLRRIPRGMPVPPDQAQLLDTIRAGTDAQWREVESRLDQLANRLSSATTTAPPRHLP